VELGVPLGELRIMSVYFGSWSMFLNNSPFGPNFFLCASTAFAERPLLSETWKCFRISGTGLMKASSIAIVEAAHLLPRRDEGRSFVDGLCPRGSMGQERVDKEIRGVRRGRKRQRSKE
jgi:hypothetical protein